MTRFAVIGAAENAGMSERVERSARSTTIVPSSNESRVTFVRSPKRSHASEAPVTRAPQGRSRTTNQRRIAAAAESGSLTSRRLSRGSSWSCIAVGPEEEEGDAEEDDSKDTFESALTRLEQIVASLEKGDLSLEASLKLYEEGIARARFCQGQLEAAEAKIEVLTQDARRVLERAPKSDTPRSEP